MWHYKKSAVAAIVLLAVSSASSGSPALYTATYTASLGPSGVGSFYFDSETGAITSFLWNFADGAFVGGIADGQYGTQMAIGDTRGRFVFEILSGTDTHPAPCYEVNNCETGDWIGVGVGPQYGDYLNLTAWIGAEDAEYRFYRNSALVAAGTITIAPVLSPSEMLNNLAIAASGVGPGKRLVSKVELAYTYYLAGDIQATCAVLTDFISSTNDLIGEKKPKISLDVALNLVADAEEVMRVIGCQ